MEIEREGKCRYCKYRFDFIHHCSHCKNNYPDQYELDYEYFKDVIFKKEKDDA